MTQSSGMPTPMIEQSCPDTSAVLAQLKDFQRDTVEHVFRRMYLDPDCSRRYLIADEVGLGKTLVARGIIAKTIEHLWDRRSRIDIIYVCSNTDIARQNINRLNLTGSDDFTPPSRITLLPITVHEMQRRRLNFISFTPNTSFDLQSNPGWSTERELLYWLLKEPWSLSFKRATCVLRGNAEVEGFRYRVKRFPDSNTIDTGIASKFAQVLKRRKDLRNLFDSVEEQLPRAGAEVPTDLKCKRNHLIGELRKLLAETCLHWLKPDLIILDEFQRFKHLLQGSGEETSEASQLADHLFNYQTSQSDPSTATRVLLLSATPYKMYTLSHETEQDDHYGDFQSTLDFLASDNDTKAALHKQLRLYREELYRLADLGTGELIKTKQRLEELLKKVMVRTERLAISSDRNGMLSEIIPNRIAIEPADVEQYLALQKIARLIDHKDVMEHWKSAPYLLNFMEEYDLKNKFNSLLKQSKQEPDFVQAVANAKNCLLQRKGIERYRPLAPSNARLRYLQREVIDSGAWQLLWVPPAFSYYQGKGAFADPQLAGFTKRLIFSCWRVVPKTIASILSYEAERRMIHTFRKSARNTLEARKKRKPLLRFAFRQGNPTGMPVLALIFPCQTFAQHFDPLKVVQQASKPGVVPTLDEIINVVVQQMAEMLTPLFEKYVSKSGPPDESWYWAAPILLDLQNDPNNLQSWFGTDNLEKVWAGEASGDTHTAGRGWKRHIDRARQILEGGLFQEKLGPPPLDLARILALLAIAGPGTVALRALERNRNGLGSESKDCRLFAAPLAHSFLHLFNLPEVMGLLRDRDKLIPYWQSVLEYCAAGNLQATMDEYSHVLVESLGLVGSATHTIAERVSHEIQRCLKLRTSTVQADLLIASKRRVRQDEPIRFRTRFAMRFGDQDVEDSSEPTRADLVRAAFNSPFWPFVLTTTSVGQEGLDFHTYCHAVVHWNLPSNPVDMEQREGRVHRYKGHAVRKNIATCYASEVWNCVTDPWSSLFEAARRSRPSDENDLFPFWIAPNGPARIERHIICLPHSRDMLQKENLRRTLVLYRMVFGQNRQEDIVNYLVHRLSADEGERVMTLCRVDLSPPRLGH